MKIFVILSLVVVACRASVNQQRSFPKDFLFGCSSAAYQIEGGWNADGKGENIWDYLTHNNPSAIADGSNGDIAADSYNNYKRDVEMTRELGLDVYRFSLSWTRILPTGFSNEINPAGVEYYNNLINELLKYNIVPIVTIYHWDLPQKLQELGGFSNPLIAEWLEDYARVVFSLFGDRVKHWITINEPREICNYGYGGVFNAPLLNATAVGTYLCAKHLVLAHANVYHAYNNDFKPTQGGQCGITLSVNWNGPLTDSEEDKFAAELKAQAEWGLYAEAIFSAKGGFPKEFAERVAKKSAEQGYSRSRLPEFTEEEKNRARGASDFFGINHYTGIYVTALPEYKIPAVVPSQDDDLDVGTYLPAEWPVAASHWLALAPNSLYNVLTTVQKKYNNPVIYVTENGWSNLPNSSLIDDDRIRYYRAAWENLLDALDEGVNIKGYMAWSLMDNFEWTGGYTQLFGMYQVDFEDPARTRTAKKSALVYKHLISNRYLDHDYEPEDLTISIDEGH